MVTRSGSGRTCSTTSPPGISGRRRLVTLRSTLLRCAPHVPIGRPLAHRRHAICGRTTTGTASAADRAADCRARLEPWTEIDLYFGRNISGDGTVTEAEFCRFLSDVVTPRFPDGLSVLDVAGQFRNSKGKIARE